MRELSGGGSETSRWGWGVRDERMRNDGREPRGTGGMESSLVGRGPESMSTSCIEDSRRRSGWSGGSMDMVRPRRMGERVERETLELVLRWECKV